jgi:D-alanyl-D-alanine carboxypeptidase
MRQIQPSKKAPVKKPILSFRIGVFLFIIALLVFIILPRLSPEGTSTPKTSKNFNKNQYSVNEASSIWAVVNKGRALPSSYIPTDLVAPNVPLRLPATDPEMQIRSVAVANLQQMFNDAKSQGLNLMVSSAYRSYILQQSVYGSNVSSEGQQGADSSSAKPGHSEHQTGLAVDIEPSSRECEVESCFADTAEGKWLATNSYKYGFIIRYQKGAEKLSGYEYEPWHVRYVGKDLAQQIHESNKTLEQFFGLPSFTSYAANPYTLK